jgi:hypothetical protein
MDCLRLQGRGKVFGDQCDEEKERKKQKVAQGLFTCFNWQALTSMYQEVAFGR